MNRISAGAIAAQSYRFAFGSFFRILGIVWLPLAFEFGALYLLAVPYFHAIVALFANLPQHGEPLPPAFVTQMQSLSSYAMLFVIAGLFLRAVMMLGITQESLGLRKGPPFVYFAIGKDVWRLFGSYFIFYIMMQIAVFAIVLAVMIPAVIVGVIAAATMSQNFAHTLLGGSLIAVGIFLVVLLVYGGIFYFVLRMGFLLTPVVVVEKKIDIARIWNLSKGNVWRMFLVSLAILLPVMIVYLLVLTVLLLHAAWPAFSTMPSGNNIPPEIVGAHMMAFFKALWSEWFLLVPLAVFFSVVVFGLSGGAMAFSYRALVPTPEA